VDGDSRRSSTTTDGGAAPVWGSGAGETQLFDHADIPNAVRIDVFDEDIGSASDLIGSRTVDFTGHIKLEQDWHSASWFEITDEKGELAGEVHLILRWAVPLPLNAPLGWHLRVVVLECSELKKMASYIQPRRIRP
jgi:hypothetical protein